MDLNWCPVCEQHIPLAWESSLYCSDRCKKADALGSQSTATGAAAAGYPGQMMDNFPGRNQRTSISSPSYSPLSSPTLAGLNSTSLYPSPPTSPMSNYVYNNTSAYGRISPASFSLGQPAHAAGATGAGYDLELRRKSLTTMAAPQYSMNTKKSNFW
ncbi:hypothetical protein BGZ96_004779 [Linnemannia gamsii]|uniref:Life-span regulatory factor n=1 Tax=Linnemannia gamsii TaxID=64522 RepID=A0ABQ7K586_9FUNG|nr:hypothetical protein BGZ96_004779 [Linnemannia gamsii]